MLHFSKTHRRSVAGLVVLLAVLFACPANAAAIPITEYEQRLKHAINDLATLAHVDKDWDEVDFENRADQTVESIRTAFPEHQTVEVDQDVCSVDNSSLHKTLEQLKQVAAGEKFPIIDEITQRLQALAARVAERRIAAQLGESKEQAKSKLESILARPE